MSWGEGSIRVQVGALEAAASLIATSGGSAQIAQNMVEGAGADSGAFGGEPAGAAFSSACARGADGLGSISEALSQLSFNTGAAAQGYVVTDRGAIPSEFGTSRGFQDMKGGP